MSLEKRITNNRQDRQKHSDQHRGHRARTADFRRRAKKRAQASLGWLFLLLPLLLLTAPVFGQGESTAGKADQVLRGSGRVNASTLGMEMSVSLGNYPGRGINIPINLSYSSKVWRMELNSVSPLVNNPGKASVYQAVFGEDSAAGWTSSMGAAAVEYTGFDNLFDSNGHPIPRDPDPNDPPPNYYSYVKRLQIHLPGGESHELRRQDAPVSYPRCVYDLSPCADANDVRLPANWNGWYYATDGSNLKYYEDRTNNVYYLLLPDGARYDFASATGYEGEKTIRPALRFTDRSGNRIDYSAPDATHPNGFWKDTLGRELKVPLPRAAPTAPGVENYDLPGLTSGSSLTYKFHWKKLKGATAAESAINDFGQTLLYVGDCILTSGIGRTCPHTSDALFHSDLYALVGYGANAFNPVLLAAVELPDGTQYRFRYNVYGEIERVEYPTGGAETFTYQTVMPLTYAFKDSKPLKEGNRGVAQRRVFETADAGTPQIWTYEADYAPPGGYRVGITNPDATRSERFLYQANGSCPSCAGTFGYDNALAGMAYEERLFDGGNGLKSQVFRYWDKTTLSFGGAVGADWHPRLAAEKNVVYEGGGSGLAATSVYEFDGDLSLKDTPLLVKKTTAYHYETSANPGVPNANAGPPTYAAPTAAVAQVAETTFLISDPNMTGSRQWYLDRNLIGLPTITLVRDAANTVKARTEIGYDESTYALSSTGTLPTAAANSWIDLTQSSQLGATLGSKRGLPTTVRSYSDLANAPTQYIETHTFYDQYGNARKTKDGRGFETEMQYDAANAFAYPTKTVSPIPGGNGSTTAFETTVAYDYNTGLPTSKTDANNLQTRMDYNDSLLRPTKVQQYFGGLPVGAATETVYGAGTSAATRYVKTRAQIDETKWKEGYSWYDGLGRPTKTQSVDAASGDVFALTCYDAVGRVGKTSNPFRNVPNADCSSSLEWTTVSYDQAGRAWKTTTADGAVVQTNYSLATSGDTIGTATTVTDQALKQRRLIINALGQLKRVDEPTDTGGLGAINAPNQPTYYDYDTLSNLVTVKQGGTLANPEQTRSFVYDSLSRLKSATNPEAGLIQYAYDNNGNLTSKTDPRGVTTSYGYDALNRVTSRTYSAASNPANYEASPNVVYTYDNLPNAKGRLTKVTATGAGANTFTAATEYQAFDQLGRVTQSQQTVDGTAYGTTAQLYKYNLSGALVEQTYPSGRVVKNVLDNEGDLALVQSKKNGNYGYWNYAKSFSYTAAGAVSSMQLGNGKWESTQFNSRLQPVQIALGGTQNATDLLKLNFAYNTTTNGAANADNNGNVISQTITVPTETRNSTTYTGFTATQNYSYDSLNRLKSAEETIPSQTGWKQTFKYDRYGNRQFDYGANPLATPALTTTPGYQNSTPKVVNPEVLTTNNRFKQDQDNDSIPDYLYDAAGNTTKDVNNKKFTYDGENKQVKVETVDSYGNVTATLGEYYYDGDGKRVKKKSATETTIFIYDAVGKLVAEYANQIATTTAQVSYLTSDHLGSPRINTDQNGDVTSRHDYQPFGEEIYAVSSNTARTGYNVDEVRKQFTSYERDVESGLDYAQSRYYYSRHGRFISVDPLTASATIKNPQTFNRYSYVLNSPYKFIDPLGLAASSPNSDNTLTPDDTLEANRLILDYKGPPGPGLLPLPEPRFELQISHGSYGNLFGASNGNGRFINGNGVILNVNLINANTGETVTDFEYLTTDDATGDASYDFSNSPDGWANSPSSGTLAVPVCNIGCSQSTEFESSQADQLEVDAEFNSSQTTKILVSTNQSSNLQEVSITTTLTKQPDTLDVNVKIKGTVKNWEPPPPPPPRR